MFRFLGEDRWRYFVTAGALMSYGIDNIDVLQKAASYVDRLLRGLTQGRAAGGMNALKQQAHQATP
jgi:ABC-type uncharacterized transport system substrate-binding protein